MVFEAAHNHVYKDRLFKFSGVVPDITRFCHMTMFFMSDVSSLSLVHPLNAMLLISTHFLLVTLNNINIICILTPH